MKYTDKNDKEQIKKEFSKLLIEHGYTLRSFCLEFGYKSASIYPMISDPRYHIDHDKISEMIKRLDEKKSLQRIGGKMIITKTF